MSINRRLDRWVEQTALLIHNGSHSTGGSDNTGGLSCYLRMGLALRDHFQPNMLSAIVQAVGDERTSVPHRDFTIVVSCPMTGRPTSGGDLERSDMGVPTSLGISTTNRQLRILRDHPISAQSQHK